MEKLLTQLNIRWKIFVTFKRITGHTHSHTQIVKLDDVSDIPLHEKIYHSGQQSFELLVMFT